jgi:hypothetical protein
MKQIKAYRVRVIATVTVFATNGTDAKKRAEQVLTEASRSDYDGIAEAAGWTDTARATSFRIDHKIDPRGWAFQYDSFDDEDEAANTERINRHNA